jgi:hypothetical protein
MFVVEVPLVVDDFVDSRFPFAIGVAVCAAVCVLLEAYGESVGRRCPSKVCTEYFERFIRDLGPSD